MTHVTLTVDLSTYPLMLVIICDKYGKNPPRTVHAVWQTWKYVPNILAVSLQIHSRRTLKLQVKLKGHYMQHTLSCWWSFVPNMDRINPELLVLQSRHAKRDWQTDRWRDKRADRQREGWSETNILHTSHHQQLHCVGYKNSCHFTEDIFK